MCVCVCGGGVSNCSCTNNKQITFGLSKAWTSCIITLSAAYVAPLYHTVSCCIMMFGLGVVYWHIISNSSSASADTLNLLY